MSTNVDSNPWRIEPEWTRGGRGEGERGEGLTDCGDGGDDFTQLQLVQDGGFTSSVKTDHQNPHFLSTP